MIKKENERAYWNIGLVNLILYVNLIFQYDKRCKALLGIVMIS